MSMGRFQVSPVPVALPGKCVVCGSVGGDGRQFVDFGFDIDFYGVVYFCSPCIAECARAVGFVPHHEAVELQRLLGENENRLREVLDECSNLRAAVDALTAAGYSISDDDDVPVENGAAEPVTPAGTVDRHVESDDGAGLPNVQQLGGRNELDALLNL